MSISRQRLNRKPIIKRANITSLNRWVDQHDSVGGISERISTSHVATNLLRRLTRIVISLLTFVRNFKFMSRIALCAFMSLSELWKSKWLPSVNTKRHENQQNVNRQIARVVKSGLRVNLRLPIYLRPICVVNWIYELLPLWLIISTTLIAFIEWVPSIFAAFYWFSISCFRSRELFTSGLQSLITIDQVNSN